MALERIVIVSKDADIRDLAKKAATNMFVADDTAECLDIVKTVNPEVVLFDLQTEASEVRDYILASKSLGDIPVVVAGSFSSEEIARGYIDAGVERCIDLSDDTVNLFSVSDSGGPDAQVITDDVGATDENAVISSMVGESDAFKHTMRMINMVAGSQCNPVLIVGETGTGKELAAMAVHNFRHSDKPFVAVNCAALTANLLESELFGHVKGSFTGADKDKVGLLELAGDGTLFLDEISEMPLELQAKLLRVLQERNFRKVGGTREHQCRATIIASSNRNLKMEVEENRFRRDLYYRLNVCPIALAPLRSPHRKSDISFLAEHFLSTSTICPEKKGRIKSLTRLAMKALEEHDWQGNVRELKNVIERAIMLEPTDKIGLSSIVFDVMDFEQPCNENKAMKNFSLANAEKELIAKALQETGWQKTRAASLLGITRATLYAKVKQYNIEQQTKDDLNKLEYAEPVSMS